MNIRHVFSALFLFGMMSCAVGLEETLNKKRVDNDSEKDSETFDHNPVSKEHSEHPDPWDCGTEIIEVDGPDGSLYLVEVPLPCEPLQDEYKGCPVEQFSLPEKQGAN